MSLVPTPEQSAILDAYVSGDDLVIEAGAGTGKTSTLRMLGSAQDGRSGVYIAYNRAIADDARGSFPPNVTCSTAHSLAFRAVGKDYAHRLNGPRLPARESAKVLGTSPLRLGDRVLSPDRLARHALRTVGRYCYSASDEIEPWHVEEIAGLEESHSSIVDAVLPVARTAWEDLRRPHGRLKFEHDHYLKLWALSRPLLDVDVVMLDEAQDANPLIAQVFEAQDHAQRVSVGDQSQSIYGWRGAVDYMARATGRRLKLSQSFRFGPAVADEANKWLGLLEAELRLTGWDQIPSRVGIVERPAAVLCRSNAEAVSQVVNGLEAGRRVALVGGGDEIRRLAEAAISLQAGRGTDHPELFAFRSWSELQEYVEDGDAGSLRTFVRLIDSRGAQAVITTMDRLVPEDAADLVVSTAHKAKGREWESVLIGNDYPESKRGDDDHLAPSRGEWMLNYVSVTRARRELDLGGLSWIDKIRQPKLEVV